MNKRDIINDENAWLADGSEILDHAFRAEQPIAAAIESPGAAERAVPWAPAREFDRGAGVEHADEVFAAVTHEVARGPDLVEVLDETRPRTLALCGDGAGHLDDRAAVARHGFKKLNDARLALALEHAIDRALAMFQNGSCREGGAVATNADEGARQTTFGSLRQIDDLGHIGEVVAGEGDEIRLPFRNHAVVVGVAFDLQIQEPHGVPSAAGSISREFEAEWFKPKENVGVDERSRMNEQKLHGSPRGRRRSLAGMTELSRSATCLVNPSIRLANRQLTFSCALHDSSANLT